MPEVIRKMNVRSPFYIVADSEGIPGVITEDPVKPADFVIPTTLTQNVECDSTVNVGQDIGKKIYRLEVGEVTGDVSLNYTITRVPIEIKFRHSNTEVNANFRGSNKYAGKVTEYGGQITNLVGTDVATGTLTFSKATAQPTYVDWEVNAPFRTEGYVFTFSCPTIPLVEEEVVYAATPTHSQLVNRDPYFYFPKDTPIDIYINNTKVTTGDTLNGYYVISDFDDITPFKIFRASDNLTPTFITKSSHIRQKIKNVIEFRFKEDFDNFQFRRGVNGVFYNSATSSYEWANALDRRPVLYDYITSSLSGIELSNLIGESTTIKKDTRIIFEWDTGASAGSFGTNARKILSDGSISADEYYGIYNFASLEKADYISGSLNVYFIAPPFEGTVNDPNKWIPRYIYINSLYNVR